jgi:hypothetical protein
MPRFTDDGYTKVAWGQFADKEFIALSELAAAEDIECGLTGDGLNTNTTENEVDDAALCETYDATLPGTFKVNPELTLKRQNTENGDTDTYWDLFSTRGETGALVVRRGITSETAWTAGQKVEVYPGTTGIRKSQQSARNQQTRFMLTIYGSSAPALDGVVVAS